VQEINVPCSQYLERAMPKISKPIKHRSKWRIRWLDEHGERRSEVHDKHSTALAALRAEQARIEEVRRGLRLPVPQEHTFAELCDYWLANRASQKRSGYHDESIIRCHLRPFFGGLQLVEVGVAQVDRFVVGKGTLTKKTVNNHLTLLISMLNAAVDLGWLIKAPRIRKPKQSLFSADYSYLRTQAEMDRFLSAANEEGQLVYALYLTALCTGMREGELAGLRWDDIDFENRLITVQRSFDGPTKAGDVRYVPLLDVLLPTLRKWRLACPGMIPFPNRAGGMLGKSGRVFQEVFHRVLDRAGFPKQKRRGKDRRYIVFHDLRHSFASHWMLRGGDIFRLQKILGHKSMQMTMRYAHLAPAAFVEDHARFGASREPGPGRVVGLTAPAEGLAATEPQIRAGDSDSSGRHLGPHDRQGTQDVTG
jgi:integrase